MKLRDQYGIPIKVRCCDTMGYGVNYPGAVIPRSVPGIIYGIMTHSGVPSELIEWHGHNDFYKAVSNSTTAWLYGACGVNCSLFGIGERTGNTPLEAMIFEYAQLRGTLDGMDTTVITDLAEYYENVIGYKIPERTPFVGRNFNITRAGIHADGLLKNEEIYNIFDTEKFLKRPVEVAISNTSGLAGIAHWVNRHYEVPEENPIDKKSELVAMIKAAPEKYAAQMDAFQPHLALEEIFKLIQRANKYIDETAPWILAKDEAKKTRLATVMYNLLEALRVSLIMLTPFIPESCGKAFAQIGADENLRTWDSALTYGALPAEVEVHKGETLFPRIDAAKMLEELEKAEQAAKGPKVKYNPVLPDVSIDEFAKCDMRVCKVLACEAVKKSDKLLKFQLDDGSGTPRQILSGIHKFYEPEELVGKTVVAILNLPPRKMMGQESNGMLLSALREVDGKEELHLIMLDDSVPAGAQLC